MIYSYTFNGLPVQTGDVLCTSDGQPDSLFGRLWRIFGLLVPGEIDHCILYTGPGGRCVESGAGGVITFEMPGPNWDSPSLFEKRILLDALVGVAYPLANRTLDEAEEAHIRRRVAKYCLNMAAANRPYNLNYFNPNTGSSFYCSQLVYKAYQAHGIDLRSQAGLPDFPLLHKVVFPTEIWNACPHTRVNGSS
jgi:hypothetical protein